MTAQGDDTASSSTSPSVSEALRPLADQELASLSRLGRQWKEALGDRSPPLPVDPSLDRSGHGPTPSRFGRFTPISMFRVEGPRGVLATEQATEAPSVRAGAVHRLRRVVLGPPLASSAVVHERMRKLIALPVPSGGLAVLGCLRPRTGHGRGAGPGRFGGAPPRAPGGPRSGGIDHPFTTAWFSRRFSRQHQFRISYFSDRKRSSFTLTQSCSAPTRETWPLHQKGAPNDPRWECAIGTGPPWMLYAGYPAPRNFDMKWVSA
jgi:hypothetical protein